MSKRLILSAVLAAAVLVPAALRAHEGHLHKVMGTVSNVQGVHVDIKTTDGKVVTVMLDQKTTIMRGKVKLDRAALVVGERVSIDAMEDKSMMMASAIRLGTVPAKK